MAMLEEMMWKMVDKRDPRVYTECLEDAVQKLSAADLRKFCFQQAQDALSKVVGGDVDEEFHCRLEALAARGPLDAKFGGALASVSLRGFAVYCRRGGEITPRVGAHGLGARQGNETVALYRKHGGVITEECALRLLRSAPIRPGGWGSRAQRVAFALKFYHKKGGPLTEAVVRAALKEGVTLH